MPFQNGNCWTIGRALAEGIRIDITFCYVPSRSIIGIAKIFWSGRFRAVRLPKEFHFDTAEVRIRRHGNAVILEPIAGDWTWLDEFAGPLDDDFVQAVSEQPEPQERPVLDFFE